MVFNSVVFLFCFLPLSLLLYYLVPGRAKNAVLLAESLIFYCWTGVAFLPLIAVLIVFNYLWALLTARAKAKLRGLLPLAAVLVDLGVLVYFQVCQLPDRHGQPGRASGAGGAEHRHGAAAGHQLLHFQDHQL